MAKLKLLNTIFSKLASLSKNDGQIVVTRDSKSLYIDLEGERIEITHRSSNRTTYAQGSLRAARFLENKNKGMYSMQDVLNIS